MKRFTGRDDLRELLAAPAGARVSIYLSAPTEQGFPDITAVSLRYRSAVREAREKLETLGASEEVLREATSNLERADLDLSELPRGAWTIAAFWAPGFERVLGIPTVLGDRVHVARSFSLLPLFKALHLERPYRLLALSTNRVALFEGDANGLTEVRAPEVPSSLTEALGERVDTGDDLQSHSSARGGMAPVFHGHGGADAGRSTDIDRFHKVLGRTVAKHWSGVNGPLVLAADKQHQGRFRASVRLPGLLEQGVEGNPDELDAHALHERAWPMIRAHVEGEDAGARSVMERARNQGKLATRFEEIRDKLLQGLVHRLVVREDAQRPGFLQGAELTEHPPHMDDDQLEELAAHVFLQGGEVVPMRARDLPDGMYMAAELRG